VLAVLAQQSAVQTGMLMEQEAQRAVFADLVRGQAAQREEHRKEREENRKEREENRKEREENRKEREAQRAVLADLVQGQAAQRDEQTSLLRQILDRLTPRAHAAARAAAAPDALNTAVLGAPSASGSDGEAEGAGGHVLGELSAGGSVLSAGGAVHSAGSSVHSK